MTELALTHEEREAFDELCGIAQDDAPVALLRGTLDAGTEHEMQVGIVVYVFRDDDDEYVIMPKGVVVTAELLDRLTVDGVEATPQGGVIA